MKKKVNKKNGSTSNAGGADGGNNGVLNDKHHNRSTPCSNVAAVIALEIFPSASSLSTSAAGIGTGTPDNNNALGDGGKKVNNSTTGGKKNNEENPSTNDESSSTTKREQQQQPLLGLMIQNHLVEERKKARASEVGNNQPGSSKKKKNKKKRKKKPTASSFDEGAAEEMVVGGAAKAAAAATMAPKEIFSSSSASSGKENSLNNVENSSSAGDVVVKKSLKLSGCLTSYDSTTAPAAAATSSAAASAGTPAAPSQSGGGKEDDKSSSPTTGLDRLLDSIIDSNKASNGGNETNGANRTLEDFSSFLIRKLEAHSQQQQSQQKKDKKSSSSTTGTTSPLFHHDNETRRGMEYKDILPTISIAEAKSLSGAANCRTCRTSAASHLRKLIREEPFLVAADTGIEIEHHLHSNSEPTVVVLDEEMARIKPLRGGTNRTGGGGGYGSMRSGNGAHGGLSIPISDFFADGIESAFDYRMMNDDVVDLEVGAHGEIEKEESGGNGSGGGKGGNNTAVASSSSFRLELRPISRDGDGKDRRFLQIATNISRPDGIEGGSVQQYPMTTREIIDLVKCILLPCGLEQTSVMGGEGASGDAFGRTPMTEDELADITKKTFKMVAVIQTDIFKAKSTIYGLKVQMEKVDDTNNRTIFDSKTAKMLQDVDKRCEDVLSQLGTLMLRLIKSACIVGWSSSEHGRPMLEFVLSLWDRHSSALVELVVPVMRHRGTVLRASEREGTVPQAYTSKVIRDSLWELVRAKLSILNSLGEDFKNMVLGPVSSGGPSQVVRLLTLEAYRRHLEPKIGTDNVFPDQEGEDMYVQFVAALVNLAQDTIKGASLEVLKKKAEDHRSNVTSISRKVRKIIIATEDLAPETKVEYLAKAYDSFESSWYEFETRQNELENNISGTEVEEVSLLLKKSGVLAKQWIVLLCSRQCNESLVKSFSMPSCLRSWLNSISGVEMPKIMPSNRNVKHQCEGDGGERRVSSILAALLYRWLEDRCSEWHAELTRDELLLSMDMEEPTAVARDGGNNKNGKKKKSKRKAGNKAKSSKDDKNDSQAQEISSDAADKISVAHQDGASIEPLGKNYQDFESSQDEKKDDQVEVVQNDADAESIKLAQSLMAMEERAAMGKMEEVTVVEEGEWKEKKSKRKTGGGTNKVRVQENKRQPRNAEKESERSKKLEANEVLAVAVSQVDYKDVEDDVGTHGESKLSDSEDKKVVTTKDLGEEIIVSTMGSDETSVQSPQTELDQEDEFLQEEGEDNANCEYRPSVGIVDGKQVVAAETYLIQRLQAIARLRGTQSTSGTEKVPIVWM